MQTQILTFNSENLKKCADEILSGGIVAFPTETVYGLGANALDENAVKKIYVAKGRPSDNPLICHVSNKAQIEKLGDVTPFARKIIDAFMPGPITVVLSKKNCVSGVVTGGLNTAHARSRSGKDVYSRVRGAAVCAVRKYKHKAESDAGKICF